MAKQLYTCPLCSKQSAYISEYGMTDSVICKCQGLNEVGRLVNGTYIPHHSLPKNSEPIVKGVASNGQPYVATANHPILPQGNGRPKFPQLNILVSQNFTVYLLAVESEIEAAGNYFNNALKDPAGRKHYMPLGDIYYAEHKSAEGRSLMFYVDKVTKEAVNFYAKNNVSGQLGDIDEIKDTLRKNNLIKN